MRRRPGTYARTQARVRYRAILAAHRLALALISFGYYGVLVAAHVLWPSVFSDVLFGALVVVWPWALSIALVSDPSAAAWARGADSEAWTATELRKVLGRSYAVLNDLQLSRGNADHVVVGPAGIFVVEVKWSSKPWGTLSGYDTIRTACRQAKDRARQVRAVLAEHGVVVDPEPLVVLWDGGSNAWRAERCLRRVESTAVAVGTRLRVWADSLEPTRLSRAERDSLVDVLMHARGCNEDSNPALHTS